MMKTYNFYDTSSLLKLQEKVFIQENQEEIIISTITLQELENIKNSNDKSSEIKYAARHLVNLLEEHFNEITIITYKPEMLLPIKEKSLEINNDMKILACAIYYDTYKHPDETLFITNDLNLMVFANLFFGEDSIRITGVEKDNYKGYWDVTLDEYQMSEFYSKQNENVFNLYIGQYLIIRNSEKEIVDKLVWTGTTYRRLNYQSFTSRQFGDIKPIKNDPYQAFAADSLINNKITMLKGPAGSGKTYLSLGYLFQQLEKGNISKIVVFCNTVASRNSAKLGYYPGTRDEKLLDSQVGNLLISKIGSRIEVERLIDDGVLVLLPLADLRGYETPSASGVYISEAQNLDIELMKIALTRIGEDSFCIIDGDDNTQVDLPAYAGEYNGMKRVSKIYRDHDFYGEIELQIVHRSKIADLARLL